MRPHRFLAPLAFAFALAPACGGGSSGSGGSATTTTPLPPLQSGKVTVLFTSDEHSHLFAFSPELDDHPAATTAGSGALVGGAARRKVVLDRERKAAEDAGKDSLTVSAGDNQMGALPHTAFESESIDYGTMASLGYDVTTIGNHELDFGPAALARSIKAAQAKKGLPPIVASNIHFSDEDPGDDDLAALYGEGKAISKYRVVTTKGGLKVGFIGYVGVNASHVAQDKTPVQFSEQGTTPKKANDPATVLPLLYEELQPIVDELRTKERAQLVIALSHAGIVDPSSDETIKTGEDYLVAQNVTGIDLIVSGHTHIHDSKPITVKNKKGATLILHGGAFGKEVGRVDFSVKADGSAATWDPASQALLPVDDTVVPDPAESAAADEHVAAIEKGPYLSGLLARVEGAPVSDDPTKAGDLYFRPIGKTTYDVTDPRYLVFLSADAMLTAADAWAAGSGEKIDMALESEGQIRAELRAGKTGVISAADAFNIEPLGRSPVTATIGYPLSRAYLNLIELRGIFEAALGAGLTNTDYAIGAAGIKCEYDLTRPTVGSLADLLDPAKGRVMRLLRDTDHKDGFEQFDEVIYDRTLGIGNQLGLFSVVSSSYVAQFAADVGATLKDAQGNKITIADAILHRADGSEIKTLEALLGYMKASPGGTLSPLYDKTSAQATQRFICLEGCN